MSDETSTHLGLPYIQAAQAQKHVTHNEALKILDVLVNAGVQDRGRTTPPGTSGEGDRHIIAATPTGAWAGQAHAIAAYQGGAWQFYTPQVGWLAYVADQNELAVFNGSDWVSPGLPDQLGLGTTADSTNRLAVAADATLLTHNGGGHQLKLNKVNASATASLLYQSDWTGHAEMGLTGDTDFHIKSSPDGSTWHEAMVVEAMGGRVRFPSFAVPAPERAYVSTVTAQTIPSGINTYINYETVVYDTSGFCTPAHPDRITIPEAGGYQLNTYAQVQGGFNVGEGWIVIQRYTADDTKVGSYPASWVTGYTALGSPMVECLAGDYFKLMVRQNSGTDRILLVPDDRNYLSIKRAY